MQRVWLLVGDALTFLAFAALGRRAHSMGSALDDVIGTALPFAAAWLVVAPFAKAYSSAAIATPVGAARIAALTWLGAFPLGLLIRHVAVQPLRHWSFPLVAGIFTLVMLTGWRALFVAAMTRRQITSGNA